MRLSMCMMPAQVQAQKQDLNQTQKMALSQLLSQRQILQSPDPKLAARGLEGMLVADTLLKERQSCGILIGGLAESVWSLRRTPDELSKRKDVDVMVLSDDFVLEKDFEGGIDWWLPHSSRVKIKMYTGDYEKEQSWWENANGAVLSFEVNSSRNLAPGLYIAAPEWIVEMRWQEAIANVDESVKLVSDAGDVEDIFRNRIKRYVKSRLPVFLREKFPEQILYEPYGQNSDAFDVLKIEGINLSTRAGINRAMNRYQAPTTSGLVTENLTGN